MYLADYHVHSTVSPDGSASMTEMAEAAIAAGFQEIAFTDHLGLGAWGGGALRQDYDWSPMIREFSEAQASCAQRITLRLGVELGEVPRSPELAERLLAKAPPLDFIIASIHGLWGRFQWKDLMLLRERDEAECREEIATYLEVVLATARWGKFSVLGHLTLPLRYMNESRGFHMSFDGFESEVAEIFRVLIENGCGIEVNSNRGREPLPGAKWLRLYRGLGGEIITLGSDAHSTEKVGCAIRKRQELLRECGFTRFCTFDRLQPVWHTL